eukprot:SAG31_NODE_7_length_42755_cov_130.245728_15_plen_133_part_00
MSTVDAKLNLDLPPDHQVLNVVPVYILHVNLVGTFRYLQVATKCVFLKCDEVLSSIKFRYMYLVACQTFVGFFFKLGCSQGRAILRLLRFLGKLNLVGTKIVYIYQVVLSPRGEQYLDFSHMYRRYGHFLIF